VKFLTQDMEQGRAPVNTVMILRIHKKKPGNFLTS